MNHCACRSIVLTISSLAMLVCSAAVDKVHGCSREMRAAGGSYADAVTERRGQGDSREGGFHAVAVVDKKTLWAIGLEGDLFRGSEDSVILNSTDSGFSWARNLLIRGCYLRDIYFRNALTGWVVGADEQEQGLILHTTDGGQTWIRQQSTAKRTLWRVSFVSESNGWIAGWGGRVLRTSDGGRHWLGLRLPFGPVTDELNAEIKDLSFADESNGWIVGEMGRAYESTDGGASWRSRESDLTRLIKVRQPWRVNFKRVSFFSKNLGCMIVEVNDKRDPNGHPSSNQRKLVILRTENGGREWKVRRTIETPVFAEAKFLTQDEWWVRTASLASLFHTTDAGKTWREVKLPDNALDGPVVFLDSNTGWVFSFQSGFSFANLLTRDGGKTWTEQRISYIVQSRVSPRTTNASLRLGCFLCVTSTSPR